MKTISISDDTARKILVELRTSCERSARLVEIYQDRLRVMGDQWRLTNQRDLIRAQSRLASLAELCHQLHGTRL